MSSRKKTPWEFAIPAEVRTEYTGAKIGEFYNDPYIKMKVQLESEQIFHELYGLPITRNVTASGGLSYTAASVMGAKVEFPENIQPEVRERVIKDIGDSGKLIIPQPESAGVMPQILEHYEYMKKASKGKDINVKLGVNAQGPFTTAVILRGMDYYLDIVINPDESKVLMEKCTEANIALLRMVERITGNKLESLYMGDDYGGMMSPDMYGEFSFPYLKQVYDEFNPPERVLHCETLKRPHMKYLKMMGIDIYDPGVNDALSVRDILEETDVKFTYNLFTVRDMLYGTPETIRKKYIEIVNDGAPVVRTEICVGTPKENIKAYLEVAREYE